MENKTVKERKLKRVFDIAASLILLLLFAPVIIILALLLKLEGLLDPELKGPVFHKEARISRGKPFMIYKFRTINRTAYKMLMADNGNTSMTHFVCSPEKDKYLTPVGSFIVKIYFDELPQLINVLKGDMSIVGPRPHIISQYKTDVAHGLDSTKYIKGGIVGLVQAAKGNPELQRSFAKMALEKSAPDMEIILVDRLYMQKYTELSAISMLFYDLWIILKCAGVVLKAKGL